jgi:hypothetical protein
LLATRNTQGDSRMTRFALAWLPEADTLEKEIERDCRQVQMRDDVEVPPELTTEPWNAGASEYVMYGHFKLLHRHRREIPGFLLNRLQGALLGEAFRLVEQGYCAMEDIDKTVKGGLGLRWSFMGAFERSTSTRRAASPTTSTAPAPPITRWRDRRARPRSGATR